MNIFIFNLVCMEQKRTLGIDKQRFNHINILSRKADNWEHFIYQITLYGFIPKRKYFSKDICIDFN